MGYECRCSFGLDHSVSAKIVVAFSRGEKVLRQRVRNHYYANLWSVVDAAINPGNSGGALADSNGQLVGIWYVVLA